MKKLLLTLTLFASIYSYGQDPEFTRLITNDSTDKAEAIVQLTNGDYFILSNTTSFGQGDQDVQVTRTNGLGQTLWSYTYSSTLSETATDMVVTNDGGVAISGYRGTALSNYTDAFVFKINGSGTVQWAKSIYTDSSDYANAIIQANNGDLYVAGTIDLDSLNHNAMLAKFNSTGVLSWIKTYGGAGNEEGNDLVMSGSRIMVVGSTDYDSVNVGPNGDKDIYTVIVNTSGTLQSARNHGTTENDEATHVIVANNTFYVGGVTNGSATAPDVVLMTLDTLNNVQSSASIGSQGPNALLDMYYDATGSLNLAVRTSGFTSPQDVMIYSSKLSTGVPIFSLLGGLSSDGTSNAGISYNATTGYTVLASGTSFVNNSSENLYIMKTDRNFSNSCVGQNLLLSGDPLVLLSDGYNYTHNHGFSTSTSFTTSSVSNTDSTICCKLTARTSADTITICDGENARLGLSAISGYNYSWTSIGGGYSSSSANPTVSPSATTTYKLVVSSTDGQCNPDSATVYVKVNPRMNVASIADTFFCENDSVIITAPSNMVSYIWQGVNLIRYTQSIKLKSADTLRLSMIDGNACTYLDTVRVQEKPLPAFSLGSDTTICENLSITLSGPTGMANYKWNGVNSTSNTYTTSTSQVHTLEVTDQFGCKYDDDIQILTNPASTFDLGNDTSICDGTAFTIYGPTSLSNFYWNDTMSSSASLTVNEGGTYWLEAYNSFDCPAFDTITITALPLPVFSLGNDTGYCDQVNAFLLGPANMDTYLWFNGSDMQGFNATGPGLYYLSVTDNNGCSYTDSINIALFNSPVISLGPDTAVNQGQTIILTPGSGYDRYVWSTGAETESITVSDSGEYSVTVYDENGCSGSDTVKVRKKVGIQIVNGVRYVLFPNPANDVLFFETEGAANGDLQLIDPNGRVVKQISVAGKRTAIDVSDLNTGVYRVMLNSDNNRINFTVVIAQQ